MKFTDLQIVKNLKTNTDLNETYDFILHNFSKQMYYIAYNIMRLSCSQEDIEECVSDVLAYAWQNINKYNVERGSFKTWLFIITKYKALEYKRKKTKAEIVNIDDYILTSDDDTEKIVITKEQARMVFDIVKTFNSIDQELFIRRYCFEERINSLVETSDLTRSAIDNRLLRCRKKIKEVLLYENG